MNNRDEVLRAIKKATEIYRKFSVTSQTGFDLISVYETMNIPVLFRPLENMWGGAVSTQNTDGVLIHAKLPRELQRFTLAHELGHILLDHENKFDDERSLLERTVDKDDTSTEEVAANRFASELLAPRELIRQNAERQGWTKDQLDDPENIYQLSLRLGISFQAACWALVEQDLLKHGYAGKYTAADNIVKQIKNAFIPSGISKEDPWADIWKLKRDESDIRLEGSENDIFIIELNEKSGSGYRWTFSSNEDGINVIYDSSEIGDDYGSPSSRTLGFKFESPSVHAVELIQQRPWNQDVIDRIRYQIDNRGKETEGLPRQVKSKALEGVVA